MIFLKDGVTIDGISPEIVLAITITHSLVNVSGGDVVVTSLLDGEHMENSLHYIGDAFDFRIPENWKRERSIGLERFVQSLAKALGSNFDVVLEDTHIHVEYDPNEVGRRNRQSR